MNTKYVAAASKPNPKAGHPRSDSSFTCGSGPGMIALWSMLVSKLPACTRRFHPAPLLRASQPVATDPGKPWQLGREVSCARQDEAFPGRTAEMAGHLSSVWRGVRSSGSIRFVLVGRCCRQIRIQGSAIVDRPAQVRNSTKVS